MPRPTRRFQGWIGLLLLGLLLACDGPGAPATPAPPVALPDLSANYTQTEGAALIQSGLGNDGILTKVFGGDPRFAPAADLITRLGACAQEQGVAQWRVYTRRTDPLASGVILQVSQTRLTNPQVILACFSRAPAANVPSADLISPCQNSYTFTAANETYQVFYVATKQEVCADFCTALRDCKP